MSYLKKYVKLTGVEIPKGYEVHHLDHDRNNNDIENLVAIPFHLHNEYHNIRNKVSNFIVDLHSVRGKIYNIDYHLENIKKFSKLRDDLYTYENIRDSQLYENGIDKIYSGKGIFNFKSIIKNGASRT